MEKPFEIASIKRALLAVEPKMTQRHKLMLETHYQQKMSSTGRLAEAAGYKGGYRIANIQYGTLCSRIASELGFSPDNEYSWIQTIATASKRNDKHGHFQWVMDQVVRDALKELNWFRNRSSAATKLKLND